MSHSLHKKIDFSSYLRKLDSEVHLVAPDTGDHPQLFVVIDNKVVLETDSYQQGLFAQLGMHYAFNIKYPKIFKYIFQFIEDYVFGNPPKRGQYSIGKCVSQLLG